MKRISLTVLVVVVALTMGVTTGFTKDGWVNYKIERGDCLWRISERIVEREIPSLVNAIVKENGIKDPDLIYAGKTVLIPRSVRVILEKEKPSQLEQRVSQLEEKVAALKGLPEGLRGAGELIVGAIKFQAERIEKVETGFKGIKNLLTQQLIALDRMEVSVSQLRTQGWIVIAVVVAGVIIFLIVSLLILRRYYITKLKEAEKERQRVEKIREQLRQQLTERIAKLVEKLTGLTQRVMDLQKSIRGVGGSIKIKAKKDDQEVEKDCKVTAVVLEKEKPRRRLECPYCGNEVWENNMPGHWIKSCKKAPFFQGKNK